MYTDVTPATPLIAEKSVSNKLKRFFDLSMKAKGHQLKTKHYQTCFRNKLNRLFDIISCQCEVIPCGGGQSCLDKDNCSGHPAICSCPQDKRIPGREVSFVEDQRQKIVLLGGKMTQGTVDKKETKLDKEKAERESKKERKVEKRAKEAAKVKEAIKRMKEPDPELLAEEV